MSRFDPQLFMDVYTQLALRIGGVVDSAQERVRWSMFVLARQAELAGEDRLLSKSDVFPELLPDGDPVELATAYSRFRTSIMIGPEMSLSPNQWG